MLKEQLEIAGKHFSEGNVEKALVILDLLDKSHPNSQPIMSARAQCLARLGQTERALALCEELIRRFQDERARRLKGSLSAPVQTRPSERSAPNPVTQRDGVTQPTADVESIPDLLGAVGRASSGPDDGMAGLPGIPVLDLDWKPPAAVVVENLGHGTRRGGGGFSNPLGTIPYAKQIGIALVVVVLLPLISSLFLFSKSFSKTVEQAIVEQRIHWEPVSGILIVRQLASGRWEEEIFGWRGPGVMSTIRSKTEQQDNVTMELEYAYNQAPNVGNLKFRILDFAFSNEGARLAGWIFEKKRLVAGRANLLIASPARIRLASTLRWRSVEYPEGTDLIFEQGKWRVEENAGHLPGRKQRLDRVAEEFKEDPLVMQTIEKLAKRGPEAIDIDNVEITPDADCKPVVYGLKHYFAGQAKLADDGSGEKGEHLFDLTGWTLAFKVGY